MSRMTRKASRAAARKIYPRLGTLRALVLLWLEQHGPATDSETQAALGLDGSTQRPRRIELWRSKLVEPCGWGETASGRKAVLWRKARKAAR